MQRSCSWHVYIVQCADGTLYTGVTNDLEARVSAHNAGNGAKYTRARRPVALVYREKMNTHGAALRREHVIKQMPPATKRKLISGAA